MLNEIHEVKSDVVKMQTNVTNMFHELKDSITILYAEQDVLRSMVGKAAYDAAKYHLLDEDESYPGRGSALEAQIREMAGFAMRYQWKKLKVHFNVPKYIHIRRIDFQTAVRFLEDLQMRTTWFYRQYLDWVASREALKKKRGAV